MRCIKTPPRMPPEEHGLSPDCRMGAFEMPVLSLYHHTTIASQLDGRGYKRSHGMDDQFLSLLARSHLFTLLSIAWCWSVSTIYRPTRTQILLTNDTFIHQPCPFLISRIFSRVIPRSSCVSPPLPLLPLFCSLSPRHSLTDSGALTLVPTNFSAVKYLHGVTASKCCFGHETAYLHLILISSQRALRPLSS